MTLIKKLFILHLSITASLQATKYAGDFELLGTSARAIGMGSAVVAVTSDPSAIYYNPALSVYNRRRAVLLMHSEDFSGLLSHNYLAISFPNDRQAIGAALLHNGIPDIKLTTLPQPDSPPGENNRPYVYRTVNANQLITYFSFARRLSTVWAVGGNAKIIYQELGGTGYCLGIGIDAGMHFTPIRTIDIGLCIRNLSTSPLFWSTGVREAIYPQLTIGLGKKFNLGRGYLLCAIQVEALLEDRQFHTNIGAEYSLRNILFARLGIYRNNLSFGLGARFKNFHVDYGYASGTAPDARELGTPQQISGGVEF